MLRHGKGSCPARSNARSFGWSLVVTLSKAKSLALKIYSKAFGRKLPQDDILNKHRRGKTSPVS